MAELNIPVTPEMVAEFREFYEEFADPAKWSDAKITKALNIAKGEFGTCGNWGLYGPSRSCSAAGSPWRPTI